METLVIYATEQIDVAIFDVAIFDVPGGFIQNELPADNFLLTRIRDESVDVICEVNPENIPYVRYENSKKVLFLKILRAIYGCIK